MIAKSTELVTRANLLFDQAETILSNPDASAEDKVKVKALMEDAKRLMEQAGQLKELDNLRAEAAGHAVASQASEKALDRSKFKDWQEFIDAIVDWAVSAKIDPRLRRFADKDELDEDMKAGRKGAKDMNEGTGALGGFLVPAEFQATLMAALGETAIIRPRATRIPMARRQIQIPVLDQTATTGGIPHWFGGLRAYWAEEAAQKTASDPIFRQVVLTARKLIMFTRASDELLDDSAISLAAFLSGPLGFAGAIAWTEDFSFLQGDGAGKPLGVINAGATLGVTRAGAGAIAYADLTGIIRRFLPSGQGVWLVSQSAMSQLLELNGPAGNPSYIWGSAVNGAPNTLLGYPVIWTEKAPILGAKGDIGLYDFKYYLLGDRQATTVESTKFERWEFDQTSWRAVHRVDGQPWLSAPLRFQDGTTEVSPFVVLNA